MTGATYKYSLKADSGYKSDQSGKITPERHGVVCAALDGGLSDDLLLLRAAHELKDALQKLLLLYEADEGCRAMPEYLGAIEALEKATSISN